MAEHRDDDAPPAHVIAIAAAAATKGVSFTMRKTVQTIVRTTWDFAFPRPEQLAIDYDQPPAPRQVEGPRKKRAYHCGACGGAGHQAITCTANLRARWACRACGEEVLERERAMHVHDEHGKAIRERDLERVFRRVGGG